MRSTPRSPWTSPRPATTGRPHRARRRRAIRMSLEAATPVDDGHCFACGRKSEIGLHLHFEQQPDGSVRSAVTLEQPYQGWRGLAHGGVVATLLDEAMAHAAGGRGYLRI